MSPMSSWGDILTEQLGGDISIDQQQRPTRPLTSVPAPEQSLRTRCHTPPGGTRMRRSVPVRKALLAMAAILLVAGGALAADTPGERGVIRVGNLGEPPSLDAHWTTASITETLTNHIYEGLYSL